MSEDFKAGDKVKCLDAHGQRYFTPGNEYTVTRERGWGLRDGVRLGIGDDDRDRPAVYRHWDLAELSRRGIMFEKVGR